MRPARLPLIPFFALAAACSKTGPDAGEARFVGSAACTECHENAAGLIAGRAHHLAMRVAADSTVAADFSDASFTHFGTTSEFFQRNGRRFVRTAGADGAVQAYEVTHVIGVHPLEQYLVRIGGGRQQVLPFAWDTRPADQGGGRWFHLRPDEPIPHTDELHWTGPLQTWNYMCADCHVTGLARNYDVAADSYATSWKELGVQCEACHGPASRHVTWARASARDSRAATSAGTGLGFAIDLSTRRGSWVFDSGAVIARRTEPLPWNAQTEMCGACHARRETLVKDYRPGRPLLATHRPVLLEEGLYHADGQLLDEVYEYGSFLQSRMYRAGVTCTDCHDPSTQEVPPGNTACAKCHRPSVYDTTAHHHHVEGSTGASCVACHMPPRTYMVVDPRHDHSIRVPRPDLSQRIGSPNACTVCHTDESDRWAQRAVERWWGRPKSARYFGDVIAAGRRGLPSADTALIRLASDRGEAGIVRASAVSLLGRYATPAAAAAVESAARDAEPLVRLAAAMTADALPPEVRLRAIPQLLTDSLLAVRVEAARALGDAPERLLTPDQRAAFGEFVAAQGVNADQPESHLRLGVFYQQRGRVVEAERAYRDAIRIRPRFAGGYVNLADLYRALGRESEGEQVLREGIGRAYRPGVLYHSLGLLLVRRRALDEALVALAKAVELEPDLPRFAYVYAVALHSVDRAAEAVRVLETALRRAPDNAEIRAALERTRGGAAP
jgi:tetratricopeptide (TPR) repeat protein